MDHQNLEELLPQTSDKEWPSSDVLSETIDYMINSGGKRVRPLFCLKLCDVLEGDAKKARIFAKSIEAIHNFTLVHDDIQDSDAYRRGQQSVWAKYSEEQAINTGNGLEALSYKLLLDEKDEFSSNKLISLIEVLKRAEMDLIDGQSMDIAIREDQRVSESDYMRMVEKKTGALLHASLEGAAIIADADEKVKTEIRKFANRIGPAFQIRDDVIDLVGEKGRESQGEDIGEGKKSLIVLYAFEYLNDEKTDKLRQILNKPKEETTEKDKQRAMELFREANAIERANEKAEGLIDGAIRSLDNLEPKYDISEIRELANFLVERKF